MFSHTNLLQSSGLTLTGLEMVCQQVLLWKNIFSRFLESGELYFGIHLGGCFLA